MGLALYRKYRPKKLDDVVGQEHIVTSLKNAMSSNTISHAYLLTGPRGVGKTSIARILAYELNGIPYDESTNHLDIIEIDAASNRRIDEIRDLRDKVHIAPTGAKYKVYIIDEVHMLTREAFNALLKTLEEPPAHAIFILATTEAHKVPDTITSRTQRYTFKPITISDTVRHLGYIAKKEKIVIDKESLELLAEHAGGSFRDSINLLDQLAGSNNSILINDVIDILGIPKESFTKSLMQALAAKNPIDVLSCLDKSRSDGVQATAVARHLLSSLRLSIINGMQKPTEDLLTLLDGLTKVGSSGQSYLMLELALLRYVSVGNEMTITTAKPTPVILNVPLDSTKKADQPNKLKTVRLDSESKTSLESPLTNDLVDASHTAISVSSKQPAQYWQALLDSIKSKHNTLYSMLRIANPDLNDNVLTLTFGFSFHHKQIMQAANLQLISDTVSSILGRSIQVTCVLNATKSGSDTTPKTRDQSDKTHLSDISTIFSGAELIE